MSWTRTPSGAAGAPRPRATLNAGMTSVVVGPGGPSTHAGATEPAPTSLDRDIWAMAWPAILSLVVINLVDVVDVALVGRRGRQTMAAWGYACQCVHLVETLVQSVGIGCVALMARAIGARDTSRARRVLAGSTFVSQ